MKPVVWSIKDIVEVLKQRQTNEFDGNIIVSGERGNGKSTAICKIFYRFSSFNPKKHQVYSREQVVKLLRNQRYGLCWDDEAVNSGYKRDFQNKAQKELIKLVTMYRDNFNIYASAIPNFYSLDKDLRDLVFLHIHVIERGLAVIHMPLQGRLYSQDKWDMKNNARIEMSWTNKIKNNPNFRPPFHNLSTFRGYLYFNQLTEKQEELYKEIKREKRHSLYGDPDDEGEFVDYAKDFYDNLIDLLLERKLSEEGLLQVCLTSGKRLSTVKGYLSTRLKDKGIKETLSELLKLYGVDDDATKKDPKAQIRDLIS